jgi:hypothetical protein
MGGAAYAEHIHIGRRETMTAIRAMVAAAPFFSVPVPQGLEPVARDWFAAHAEQDDIVLLPGEALFAQADLADDFTAYLGAAWTAGDS